MTTYFYLAVILDLFSCKAIGHGLSKNIDACLTLKAMDIAIQKRNPQAGVIHHSGQGEYAGSEYIDALLGHAFQISIAQRENPYDSTVCKSLINSAKNEEVYLWKY